MRTTVRLDDDVAAAAQKLRRERHISMSEAVNELARAGTRHQPKRRPFRQQTYAMGLRIDVSNIAEAIEELEGPDWK